MDINNYKAMVVTEDNGKFIRKITDRSTSSLGKGPTLVHVKYSSLNYKDALSVTGNKGVTRRYPHTPGIDAAGIIVDSADSAFNKGDQVIVSGYDLGMNTSGGFSQYIKVPSEWIIKLPENLTLKESMIYGTAGFTAAQSLYKLESEGLKPPCDDILVTGATGGVGSMAVALLAKAGYRPVASTGKREKHNYLRQLGAVEVLDRHQIDDTSERAILKQTWAGVIDTVGGNTLATAIKSAKYGASVTTCGMVQSPALNTTIFPFILRGVNLLGIDSAMCPKEIRNILWQKIANEWKIPTLDLICIECSLEELDEKIDLMLAGKITGRVVVNLDK
ncbi:MAG: YhdH/YhfP family quinone oxidoreductase [Phycisphaerae bacterium]|nr:YhdH/YhfP family quinone oxidoreductase [Phycisphaerae bacterium]